MVINSDYYKINSIALSNACQLFKYKKPITIFAEKYSMPQAHPIYCKINSVTNLKVWFFSAREGDGGPFFSKELAEKARQEYINYCIENALDGGRSLRG